MPLVSWLSPFRGKPTDDTSTSAEGGSPQNEGTAMEFLDFESLAIKVEDLRIKLDQALDMSEHANLEVEKHRKEAHELKRLLEAEKAARNKAQKQLAQSTERDKQNQNQIRLLQLNLRKETVHNSQLQTRLKTETTSLRAMTKHAQAQEEKLIDTQLDLEYLKCTTDLGTPVTSTIALGDDAPLPAQPFVVVLIDGDAYKWAPDIALNDLHLGTGPAVNYVDGSDPGSMAATRIRNEVTKYILSQNGTIPVTAKIVTRAFCNFSVTPGQAVNWRKSGTKGVGLAEFALQFTEKLPLFDFVDAGRGKERADDKIRENFHLFLSTPNCYGIFVAACLDNGFARMLEQYSDHPLARQKIVLVSPGYVALEIQRLGLTETQWPNVFAHRTAPPDVVAKHEREKNKFKQRARAQRSVSTPSVRSGTDDSNILPKLLNMVHAWNASTTASGGVGFRVPQSPSPGLVSLDLAEIQETDEEVD